MIDLRQVQAFVAVVDQGSFTLAAERLHIGQSGLSAQVRKLEQRLGYPLFDRSSRAITVTPEAVALYQPAQLLLAAAEHFDRAAGTASTSPVLRLAIAENGVNALAVELLGRLRQEFPDTDLELQRVSLLDQHRGIGSEYDGVIARPPFDTSSVGSVSELLLAYDPLVLVVHESHPLAGRKSVSVDSARATERLSLDWLPDTWRSEVPLFFADKPPGAHRTVESFRDAIVSVSINRVACVMPASFARTYNLADIVAIPVDDVDPMRVVLLTSQHEASALASRLLDALAGHEPQLLSLEFAG